MTTNADRGGPVAVVTGSSTGIGFETARQLAERGFDLVLVARSAAALERATGRIREHSRSVSPIVADLAEQSQVRTLAARIAAEHGPIRVLVNNAGIFPGRRAETPDGIERCLAVNYLAPFLLTRLLLPALEADGLGRVVNVSSQAQSRGEIRLDDLGLRRRYGRLRAYDQSKLAILLFTVELARRVRADRVCVNAVDPGWVRTAQTRQLSPYWPINTIARLTGAQVSPAQGARASVRAAADPDLAGVSGRFLGPSGRLAQPNRLTSDRELARRLWELSEQLVGLPLLQPAV